MPEKKFYGEISAKDVNANVTAVESEEEEGMDLTVKKGSTEEDKVKMEHAERQSPVRSPFSEEVNSEQRRRRRALIMDVPSTNVISKRNRERS